jgi:hypothetical protein
MISSTSMDSIGILAWAAAAIFNLAFWVCVVSLITGWEIAAWVLGGISGILTLFLGAWCCKGRSE